MKSKTEVCFSPEQPELPEPERVRPSPQLVFAAKKNVFYPEATKTAAAEAIIARLSKTPAELEISGGEGALPWKIPANDVLCVLAPGDVAIKDSDRLIIALEERECVCSRVARIVIPVSELKAAFSAPEDKIKLFVEWSE